MKQILIILSFYHLASCNVESTKIPEKSTIIAKYVVHDERHSPDLSSCSNAKKDFLVARKSDCSFVMDGYEFDVENKYFFNKIGKFTEFWNYLSEGAVVSSVIELRKDINYLKTIGGDNLTIKWGVNKNTIITEKDTLKIEKIFPNYKLIWIKQDKEYFKDGLRIIIQYK